MLKERQNDRWCNNYLLTESEYYTETLLHWPSDNELYMQ